MKHVLFLFLDGVGLGPSGPENPLAAYDGNAFHKLAGGQAWRQPLDEQSTSTHLVRPLDATLGIEGLPQSGTGQASLLTGVNCAQRVGRHFGPFPHSKTHDLLDHANLFHKTQALPLQHDAPAAFANAYPPQFFNASRRRSTVTTHCCEAANVEIRDIDALRNERALPADLTGAIWRDILELDVPPRSLSDTADVLASTARQHAFTLFEYFLTDKVGHNRIDTPPEALLRDLNQFLDALLDALDPARETLLVTSDHGNLEDMSHTQHTRNPVPLLVHGWAAPHFTEATDLTDVTPGIVAALRSAHSADYSAPDESV
jgi:2,3-bisphosphoglycerate-independent phosphoglycerate mutase